MSAFLSPIFGAGAQLFSNAGIPLSGGKIYTYLAGTTAPLATWTDSTQIITNANPIILDSAGRPLNEMWLQSGSLYKLILTDSNDNILGTWDNIAGVNDITSSVVVGEWVATGLVPSYISTTSFSVSGNNTATFVLNRRVKLAVSAGTVYGYVVSSSFGGGITTVVILPDSTVLDSGVSAVSVGILSSVNPSYPQQLLAMNAPIALTAAPTTNIGAALSANVSISGVTPITAFDNVLAGILKLVYWAAATPITYNVTSMQLIRSASRTNSVGDFSVFRSLGSGNWIEEVYQQHTGNITGNVTGNVTGNADTATNSGTSGTFTISVANGLTTTPTATTTWKLNNGVVTLYIPYISMAGTSNNAFFTLGGLPAGIRPTNPQSFPCVVMDAGVPVAGTALISGGGSQIGLSPLNGSGFFTSSGTKELLSTNLVWTLT